MSPSQWLNLDSSTEYHTCYASLRSPSARSFAVRFSASKALCCLDLAAQDVEAMLQPRGDMDEQHTKWINFWSGQNNADAIKAITKRYGISPRLTALLCSSQARTSSPLPAEVKVHSPMINRFLDASRVRGVDIEKAPSDSTRAPETGAAESSTSAFGDVLDSLWHFCSVDQGPRYLYAGFNALFTVPGVQTKHDSPYKPFGIRVWTSILLCDDGTVVSIFDQPESGASLEYVKVMRNNVINIFRHLSKLHSPSSTNALFQISVRASVEDENTTAIDTESSALLFYYLFDDWITTYSLITRKNHPYRDRLEAIRQEMFTAASIESIKSLDVVGRQLTVLKLMYQSYELIIRRILRRVSTGEILPRENTLEHEYEHSEHGCFDDQARECNPSFGMRRGVSYGVQGGSNVKLPSSAVVRFQRLRDRINLYALTEIDDCLKEKDSLVFMNFNLVSLKESHAVEKLTRTTILLAKATILFLPVSLMTGYFSIQLTEVEKLYDLKTYWICFLIVVIASVMGLVVFGVATDSIHGRTTYKSLTRTLWDQVRRDKSKCA